MTNLLETNIYEAKGKILICGTCLPNMEPTGFNQLKTNYDKIFYLCLEKEHINMAITKICGMLSTKQITLLSFASVNKSPHCTQMHYITHEIKRIMPKDLPPITNIIIQNNQIHQISADTLSLSKDLVALSNQIKTPN